MGRTSAMGPRLVLAIAVLAIGVVFTLDNLGVIRSGRAIDFWPALLILAGVARWSSSRGGRQRGFAVVLVVAGAVLLLPEIDPRLGDLVGDSWPVLLVALGLWLTWDAVAGRRPAASLPAAANAGDPGEARAFALLSSVKLASVSPSFRSADLVAILGGCQLDLREAGIAPGEAASVDVLAMWGGIEIRVPVGWGVDLRVLPILGGAEDKTRRPPETGAEGGAPRLVVRGFTLMGGIEVSNGPGA